MNALQHRSDFRVNSGPSRSRKRQAGVRDLTDIMQNAESCRVLNLSKVHAEWRAYEEYSELPFFENKVLNRCIIMKHAVQPHETFNFRKPNFRATKLLFPLDRNDLSLGGLYGFVGQKNFSSTLARHFAGSRLSERDENILRMLDELPTFDPFLLYSLLKLNDIQVSALYFQLSERDRWTIQRELAGEFAPLVALCFPDGGVESEKSRIFLEKILNFAEGEELTALRESFKLSKEDFAMAMFAWRGIIYYKWRSATLRVRLDEIIAKISRIRISDPGGQLGSRLLDLSRAKIIQMATAAGERVFRTVTRYDNVYSHFVEGREVDRFRLFLKSAPGLFTSCGQSIAIMEHIMSFFETRTRRMPEGVVSAFDFAKMLTELEIELGLDFQVRLRIW